MGRGSQQSSASAWPARIRNKSRSGMFAELVRADRDTRKTLLADPGQRALMQTDLHRQFAQQMQRIGGREAAEQAITNYWHNLLLPPSAQRAVRGHTGPQLVELLQLTPDLYNVLPSRGRHYTKRAQLQGPPCRIAV